MSRNYWEAKEQYEYIKNNWRDWKDYDLRYLDMKVIIECANDKKRYTLYNATSFSQRLDLCENYDVFNFRVDREKVVYNDIRFRNIESVQCIPVNNMFHYWESYKEESSDMFNRNYPRKLTGIYEIREFYIKFNDVKDFQNIPVSDGYLCYV